MYRENRNKRFLRTHIFALSFLFTFFSFAQKIDISSFDQADLLAMHFRKTMAESPKITYSKVSKDSRKLEKSFGQISLKNIYFICVVSENITTKRIAELEEFAFLSPVYAKFELSSGNRVPAIDSIKIVSFNASVTSLRINPASIKNLSSKDPYLKDQFSFDFNANLSAEVLVTKSSNQFYDEKGSLVSYSQLRGGLSHASSLRLEVDKVGSEQKQLLNLTLPFPPIFKVENLEVATLKSKSISKNFIDARFYPEENNNSRIRCAFFSKGVKPEKR